MMAGVYNLTLLKQERAGVGNKQKQAEGLCKDIAWLRSGKCCELCGTPGREVHHVFFGRQWMNFWPARCNPAFFVNLCPIKLTFHIGHFRNSLLHSPHSMKVILGCLFRIHTMTFGVRS